MIVSDLTPGAIAAGLRKVDLSQLGKRRAAVDRYLGIGLEQEVRELFPPQLLRQVPVDVQRIAAKVIDRRYSVYQEGAERYSETVEDYADLQGNLQLVQSQVERLTGLLGTMATLVTTTETGRLHYVPLIEFEPLFLPDDPEPFGVLYPLHDASTTAARDRVWMCWTDQLYFRASGAGGLEAVAGFEDYANPYGVLPVYFSHREPQAGSTWLRPIANDVLSTQLTYNVLGVQGNAGAMLQALGQEVLIGITDARDVRRGPDRALVLPPGAGYSMEAPPGGLAQIIEWQRWKVDTLAASYGLKIKWADASGGATSGEHQRILEVELTTAIMGDWPRWRFVEDERHRVARAVAQRDLNRDLGESASVNFTEPNIPLSDKDKRERWDYEHGKNLASLKDYYRMWDADATDEQLDAMLERTAAELARERELFGGTTAQGEGAPALPNLADLFNA